jgi:tetraacyldisaccharide 4'-kinase
VKNRFYFWAERYLFGKGIAFSLIAYLLLPLSLIWAFGAYIKKFTAKPQDFGIACISIGNLVIGGTGKTPITISIAKMLNRSAIILRGYKRQSKGLQVVSLWGEIKCDVHCSGDEAMLYATSLAHALVIVSSNRTEAIIVAKQLGANCVLLDDAFAKFDIKKFDIIVKPNVQYRPFCLPSGPYRLPPSMIKYADLVLEQGANFTRDVHIINASPRMVLLSAIANASRLDRYLPQNVVAKIILPDHEYFDEAMLCGMLAQYQATSLLVTTKDMVKLSNTTIPLSIMQLDIIIDASCLDAINNYLSSFQIVLGKIPQVKQG